MTTTSHGLTEGLVVKFAREVERFPHALVNEGEVGDVIYVDDDQVGVRPRLARPELDEWDGAIMWYAEYEGEHMGFSDLVLDVVRVD